MDPVSQKSHEMARAPGPMINRIFLRFKNRAEGFLTPKCNSKVKRIRYYGIILRHRPAGLCGAHVQFTECKRRPALLSTVRSPKFDGGLHCKAFMHLVDKISVKLAG